MAFFASAPGKLYRIGPDGMGDAEVSTTVRAPFVDTCSRDGRDASLWHQIITVSCPSWWASAFGDLG